MAGDTGGKTKRVGGKAKEAAGDAPGDRLRFEPCGAVISGPAASPLEKI